MKISGEKYVETRFGGVLFLMAVASRKNEICHGLDGEIVETKDISFLEYKIQQISDKTK